MDAHAASTLLRRVDWRFLLPNPNPSKSICFANGPLGDAVALISGRVVGAQADSARDCDLAVATDPDHATLRSAWASLRAGGSCYTEWSRSLITGLGGIRRRLERTGFKGVTFYAPRTWGWLPLEAPSALRYFGNRAPAPTVIHRLLRRIRMWWLRFGPASPVCAIAHKPASRPAGQAPSAARPTHPAGGTPLDDPAETLDLLGAVRSQWGNLGFGPTPDHLSALLLTAGSHSVHKVVALVFAKSSDEPRLAVKMPRVPESGPRLTREARMLQVIHSRHPSGLRGAPRPLLYQRQAGLLRLGETALTGRPVGSLVRPSNYRDLALKATDWLSHLAGRPDPRPRAVWLSHIVEPALARLESSDSPIDRSMLRETKEIVGRLGDLPLVCEHRDFTPWNVLVAPTGELVVLDWETAVPRGLPVLDLIYFLTFLAFYLTRAWNLETYRTTLDPSTLPGGAAAECVARYVRRIGLDDAAVGPLRVLVWAFRARWIDSRHDLFVDLWEEELRRAAKT